MSYPRCRDCFGRGYVMRPEKNPYRVTKDEIEGRLPLRRFEYVRTVCAACRGTGCAP